MTHSRPVLPWIKPLWLSTWPLWNLIAFISLPVVRSLPDGFTRAAVAAPILLMIPGSLTLGAVFHQRHRPQGLVFVCYAALLSTVWSVLASLALYAAGMLITAESTYYCLLAVSGVLAIVAEARLLLGWPGKGQRAAPQLEAPVDNSAAEADDAETPASSKGAAGYSIIAAVAGASLLAGGLYAYDRLPHPDSAGYTWMAWTAPPVQGDIAIGSAGTNLRFHILHYQSGTTMFKLSAAWLGNTSTPMIKPLIFSIGPNRTFSGVLFVPSPPDGCTYRIVVTLTAAQQIDPLTKKPRTWSINADVHDPSKSSKACG